MAESRFSSLAPVRSPRLHLSRVPARKAKNASTTFRYTVATLHVFGGGGGRRV